MGETISRYVSHVPRFRLGLPPCLSFHGIEAAFDVEAALVPKGEFYTPGFSLVRTSSEAGKEIQRSWKGIQRSWKRIQRSWKRLPATIAGSNGFVRPDTLNAGCRAGAFLWSCRGAWANLRRGGTSVIRGSVRARQWLSRLTRSNASNATSPLASQCSHASHGKPNQGGSRIWPAIACRLMTQQLNRPSRRLNAGIGLLSPASPGSRYLDHE